MTHSNATNPPSETAQVSTNWIGPFRAKRLFLLILLIALTAFPGELGDYTRAALEDAYIGVSVFVAMTLALFYGAEKAFGFDIASVFRKAKFTQVPLAAMLGALPGCGGAVVVVAAYASGSVRMGAVVATLTATMGDAAFLLIAKRPDVALILLPLSFVVGIISGFVVDMFDKSTYEGKETTKEVEVIEMTSTRKALYITYAALIVPGLVFGVLGLFQYEFDGAIATLITAIALIGIFIGMTIWSMSPIEAMTNPKNSTLTRMSEETGFITAWVILAFLLFEYATNFAGLDLQAWFNTVGIALPLIAILIGFIPGCGPQILVTTFYINGLVPFAALIGNSIANDGDALFPAIALSPRAALLATIYSAIPAFFVAYGFYFLAPNYLTP